MSESVLPVSNSNNNLQNQSAGGYRPPSYDLQERTLKVTNIPEQVTKELLYELFLQCGPVKNVVRKADFAFIEFEHEISVRYSLALMDGVHLYGQKLELQPKIPKPDAFEYLKRLKEYEYCFATQPQNWWARFGKQDGRPMPPHLCSAVLNKLDHDPPVVHLPELYSSPNHLNASSQSDPGVYYSSHRRHLDNRDHRDYRDLRDNHTSSQTSSYHNPISASNYRSSTLSSSYHSPTSTSDYYNPSSNYKNPTPSTSFHNSSSSSYHNSASNSSYYNPSSSSNYHNPTSSSNYHNPTSSSNYHNPTPTSGYRNSYHHQPLPHSARYDRNERRSTPSYSDKYPYSRPHRSNDRC